jgi:hypothetical protein
VNYNGPSGVCQVDGCQKAWVMLMSGHRLCSVHSDRVIDWAREKNKHVDSLTSEEVVAVVEGNPAAPSGRRG